MSWLGKGTWGKVWLETRGGRAVAVKYMATKNVARARHEVAILFTVRHPHVVQLIDYAERPRFVEVVMEYGGRTLCDDVTAYPAGAYPWAAHVFVQITSALAHMHWMRVAHRDVKIENITVDGHCHARLIDLGLAYAFAAGQDAYLSNVAGSMAYLAPDALASVTAKSAYDVLGADVWAWAIVLYGMLLGRMPWSRAHASDPHYALERHGVSDRMRLSLGGDERVDAWWIDTLLGMLRERWPMASVEARSRQLCASTAQSSFLQRQSATT